MPKAKKLPSGNWRVQVSTGNKKNGKYVYKSFTAPTKKEAEYLGSEFLYKRKRCEKGSDPVFSKAAESYLETKMNVLSPSTIRGYKIMLRNAFDSILNIKLSRLESSALIQSQLNDNAIKYSAKSLRNQRGFISAVLNFFGYSMPEVAVKPSENKTIPVPNKQEVEQIIKLLKDFPNIECQILLAATCSLRQSEIYALTPADVCGNVIFIHGARVPDQNNKIVYKSTPKSKAGYRKVVAPKYLTERLQRLCQDKNSTDWIFNTTPSGVLKLFKRILVQNDIYPYTVHSLRHYFAAMLHAKNVPDKYVLEMGGWSTDGVLRKVYQYTFEDETKRVKEEMNRYFDTLLK